MCLVEDSEARFTLLVLFRAGGQKVIELVATTLDACGESKNEGDPGLIVLRYPLSVEGLK